MKKVLIITYYWPPAGGSGVQRWLKFVKYFRAFNVEPIVYTVDNGSYPLLDKSLQKDVPDNLKVLKQPIWEPNRILSFIKKSKTESAGFLKTNPSKFGRLLQYIRANYFIPDARRFWVKPSVNYLKEIIKEENIEVIITTGPPHSLHLIGMQLKEALNVEWIADFRDPWTDIDYFHHLPLTKKAVRRHHYLEEQVVSNCSAAIVVGASMREAYLKFNKNIFTVPNGYDFKIDSSDVNLDTKFSLTHVGLMNSDRNHSILWQAISEAITENLDFARDFELKLIGKMDASVHKSIAQYELNKYVQAIDYIPHIEVLKYQKQAQVLLLMVNNVPSAKGIITGKIFEYLASKRPIIAIAPTDGDLNEIVSNTNSGTVIDFEDKESLKKTILELYSDYKINNLKSQAINVEQYHRKELTKHVSEIIYRLGK